MPDVSNPEKGTWVLMIFTAFFGLIIAVNSVFIYNAINSHSGVVTDNPYRKGLAYNDVLEAARAQPKIRENVFYHNGVLRWMADDEAGVPLEAYVVAKLVRTVKDGHDFDVVLKRIKPGLYEVALDLPMKGQWSAQIKAIWDSKQYQARHTFIAK